MTLEEIDERYHDAALDDDGQGWDEEAEGLGNRDVGWDDPSELTETDDLEAEES